MASELKRLSSLIESQLPNFISDEYPQFSRFVEKYYEQLESRGQTLDVAFNITKYTDINYYENNLLKEFTTLSNSISDSATSIDVADASSFPETNGYIRIGEEICFYKSRTDTRFLEVSRGISGNVTLGDLYEKSSFVTTIASNHGSGEKVLNISNLFLYAIVKNFESQYLSEFPKKYLKSDVDKRSLIKNITSFYKAKGSDASIKFIFNSVISYLDNDSPEVFYPKDNTLKSSTSDWISKYSIKVKVISGDPLSLIGQKIEKTEKDGYYASAIVDNVVFVGGDIYEFIIAPDSANNRFKIPAKTKLTKRLDFASSENARIDVESTLGWDNKEESLYINGEIITFKDKNVNQFVIKSRGENKLSHPVNSEVYNFSVVSAFDTQFIILGSLYNLTTDQYTPYFRPADIIKQNTNNTNLNTPVVYNSRTNSIRWLINTSNINPSTNNTVAQNLIANLNADVSAVYEDSQYYYICSSGFPSHDFLTTNSTGTPKDQKSLKLITKYPVTTTEIYETPAKDVGILVNGISAYGCKDEEFVLYGNIEKTRVIYGGAGYKAPPYVLINDTPGKAVANLSGEVVESITITTNDVYQETPVVTITAGRNATARAVVTKGEISRIIVTNPGQYYSSPPQVRIIDLQGKGNFAEYRAIISDAGQVINFEQINPGKFYTEGNVLIEIIEDARLSKAKAEVEIRKWYKNRYTKNQATLDDSYGYLVNTSIENNSYGYGYVANPKRLRLAIGDNINENLSEASSIQHSEILGYAYDGNPIYGPYGYSDPLNKNSSVVRLNSGYSINTSRLNGPPVTQYPLGSFVDDYTWSARASTGKLYLDENNGRFCVTPDYPNGVYAYFITINLFGNPVFPYILGKNYYSLPIDSNYNSSIIQDNLPKTIKNLTPSSLINGENSLVQVQDINSGSINGYHIERSSNNFNVGSTVRINNFGTDGSGSSAIVSSVEGQKINYIESVNIKPLEINILDTCYLFEGDIVTQSNTGASGEVIGNVFSDTKIILRNVSGDFNTTDLISAEIEVLNLLLDGNSSFTKDSVVSLINSRNVVFATGLVLESTSRQNLLKVKVLSGTFNTNSSNFLRSSNLLDSSKVKVLSISSLSKNLKINTIDDKIAIARFTNNHNLTVNDVVNIDITPSDADTETTYYVRKRIYQRVKLNPIQSSFVIDDSGIGRFELMNSGADYDTGTYSNVELIFRDSTKYRTDVGAPGNRNNARARIVVSNINGTGRGRAVSVTITTRGRNYKKGDILTVADSVLDRLPNSLSTSRLLLVVDHVGISKQNTTIKLNSVTGISVDDELLINEEIVKVRTVSSRTRNITVFRGQYDTTPVDHNNLQVVDFYKNRYNFTYNAQLVGESQLDPYVYSYDENTQELTFVFDYNSNTENINEVKKSYVFYDNSAPAKVVSISSVENPTYSLQFSKSQNDSTFLDNPTIDVTKYYKYRFDTSHFSMRNTFLSFSPSKNYNIIPIQIKSTDVPPGELGSSIVVKFGYDDSFYTSQNISSNVNDDYIVNEDIIVEDELFVSTNIIASADKKIDNFNFVNYYYYDKNDTRLSGNGFINLVDDPLQGEKIVHYTTDKLFVYKIQNYPNYDGIGSIKFTTTSRFVEGKINTISILNGGINYTNIPTIDGVDLSIDNEAVLDIGYNFVDKNISFVNVLSPGKNYISPKVVVIDGDGTGEKFEVISDNGQIIGVNVINKGKNFTYKPTLKVVESDVKIYLQSDNIGSIKTLKYINSGYNYHNDFSTLSNFTSPTILLIKNFEDDSFLIGEKIVQYSQVDGASVITASGVVAENGWRIGSNILRLKNVIGNFDTTKQIKGSVRGKTANIITVLNTEFTPEIRSYSDNIGYYNSDRGKLSNYGQRLTDSYYYQDYSYTIRSKTPIDLWRDLIKQTTHPAGFQVFGEMLIESEGAIQMPEPSEFQNYQNISYINLRAEQLEVRVDKRYVTESILNYSDSNVEIGVGSACVDTRDNTETIARELVLAAPFNGDFDPYNGQVIGNKTFTLLEKESGLPYTPYNNQQLFVTLDGVVQEPGVAFNVVGSQITFATPPFGDRISEEQLVSGQKFYCRSIKFKNDELNERYLRKLSNISEQFDGIKTTFDLYYENGDIVKTDFSETLLVFLNGVLQKSKEFENVPFGNSYYIIRDLDPNITDKIEFSNPPINHEDLYDTPVDELNAREKCFIYSIGNYKRATIESYLIPYKKQGPYNIVNEITGKIMNINNPNYAMVFLDGVLQIPGKSYEINGSSIVFKNPLNYYISESDEEIYTDVSILFFYGKDLDKKINLFDFNPDTFYNTLYVNLSGESVFGTIKDINALQESQMLSCQNVLVYQSNVLLGELKEIKALSEDDVVLTLLNSTNIDLTIIDNTNLTLLINNSDLITIQGIYDISIEYEKDLDDKRILSTGINTPIWLFNTEYTKKIEEQKNYNKIATILPGDFIKLDGENEYREVLEIPETVFTKNNNPNEMANNQIFAKISCSNYNGIVRGEGLSITSEIKDGKVVKLYWNKRELEEYFKNNLLLQPSAYQYFTNPIIHFIPTDNNGGGAKAEVVIHNGAVIDVVLKDSGSNYTANPEVVVARQYSIMKKKSRKINSRLSLIGIIPQLKLDYSIISEINVYQDSMNVFYVLTVLSAPVADITRFITRILNKQINLSLIDNTRTEITQIARSTSIMNSVVSTDINVVSLLEAPSRLISSQYVKTIRTSSSFNGVVDKIYDASYGDGYYSQDVVGNRLATFNEFKFIDTGVDNISNISIEELESFYEGEILIENFENLNSSRISTAVNDRYNLGYPSIQQYGAILDIPLTITSTIVYIQNTSRFPEQGKLLIGDEIISYTSKLTDRFLGVTRGVDRTRAKEHPAGSYIRSI